MAEGFVGILNVELHFPESGSLKGKRKFVKSAKAQLQNRFGAAVAEVDHHELWQRSRLTVACVAREPREADRLLEEAVRYLSGQEYELVWDRRRIVGVEDELATVYRDALNLEGTDWDSDLDVMRGGDPIEEL
jgi:uncharacterized protein YlxP (DUF503 family)